MPIIGFLPNIWLIVGVVSMVSAMSAVCYLVIYFVVHISKVDLILSVPLFENEIKPMVV